MMAPKTSKSQVGADFCCGWGNCHICERTQKQNTFSSIGPKYFYVVMLDVPNTIIVLSKSESDESIFFAHSLMQNLMFGVYFNKSDSENKTLCMQWLIFGLAELEL